MVKRTSKIAMYSIVSEKAESERLLDIEMYRLGMKKL